LFEISPNKEDILNIDDREKKDIPIDRCEEKGKKWISLKRRVKKCVGGNIV
jgi:hypothetical protein